MRVISNYKKASESLSASIRKQAEDIIEPKIKSLLVNIAESAVAISPVWSGAYVKSMSIVPSGSGAGRMRKSNDDFMSNDNRADTSGIKQEAFSQLMSDIDSLQIMEVTGFVLRNRSKHSPEVEAKYRVFETIANRYG